MNSIPPNIRRQARSAITEDQALLLGRLHQFQCATPSLLAMAYGLDESETGKNLRVLCHHAWAHEAGWAGVPPGHALAGKWFFASRRDPRGIFWKETFRAAIVPTPPDKAVFQSSLRCRDHYLRLHSAWVAFHMAKVLAALPQGEKPISFESESFLRSVRGWYSARRPGDFPQPHERLCSVPDFRLQQGEKVLGIEIELSIKNRERYQTIVEQREEGSRIVYATSPQNLDRLKRIFADVRGSDCVTILAFPDLPDFIRSCFV